MESAKSRALAMVLGGEVVRTMPQSRSPGVRLSLPDGRVALLDELGGATYRSVAALEAYAADSDDDANVADVAEWHEWGVAEEWATGLARLIGGEAHQSGGNIWVVLFERPDGRFVVIGSDGADLYESSDHYETYYSGNWPEPGYVYWTGTAAQP